MDQLAEGCEPCIEAASGSISRLSLGGQVHARTATGGDSRTGNILRKMINTLEQRTWSWLQGDSPPMMAGVSEQPFRCWRVWYGGVVPSVARFLALPLNGNDCLKRSNPPQTHFHGNFRKNLVT